MNSMGNMVRYLVLLIAGLLLSDWQAYAERTDLIQVLPQTALNLGEFRSEETRQATFQLVNQGHNPVRISKVRAGCSCTAVATFSKEAIPPGGNGSVTLKITGSSLREGPFERSATIEFEGISIAPVILRYQGIIIRNITIQPHREIFLGYLNSPLQAWRQEFDIRGQFPDGRHLRLGDPPASEHLNVQLQEKEPSHYLLAVTPKIPQNLGPLREEIHIPVQEPQGLPPEIIIIKAQIGPQMFLVPMILDLVADHAPVEKTVLASFRHTAAEKLQASELQYVTPSGVTVIAADTNDGALLRILFSREALKTGNQGIVEISTLRSSSIKIPYFIKRLPVKNPDAHSN